MSGRKFAERTDAVDTRWDSRSALPLLAEQLYADRAFFQTNSVSSKYPILLKYARACASAQSFPCSILSTVSEGAIHVLAITLKTEACTPCAPCSENSRRCSPPTFTSAHTPSSSIKTPGNKIRRRQEYHCRNLTNRNVNHWCASVNHLSLCQRRASPSKLNWIDQEHVFNHRTATVGWKT
jgi:hypothetical protein